MSLNHQGILLKPRRKGVSHNSMIYAIKMGLSVVGLFIICSCNATKKSEDTGDSAKLELWGGEDSHKRKKAFRQLVIAYADSLTDEESKVIIEQSWQGDFMMFELNWNDLVDRAFPPPFDNRELSQIYANLGIYGRDNRSDLIRKSIYEYLKNDELCFSKIIRAHREDFIRQAGVLPPELTKCPMCGEQMFTFFDGKGYPGMPPQVIVFSGNCVNDHRHVYTQNDGWKNEEDEDRGQDRGQIGVSP